MKARRSNRLVTFSMGSFQSTEISGSLFIYNNKLFGLSSAEMYLLGGGGGMPLQPSPEGAGREPIWVSIQTWGDSV